LPRIKGYITEMLDRIFTVFEMKERVLQEKLYQASLIKRLQKIVEVTRTKIARQRLEIKETRIRLERQRLALVKAQVNKLPLKPVLQRF